MRGVVTSTSIHLGAIYVILVLMASINKLMAIPSIAFTNIKQSLKLVWQLQNLKFQHLQAPLRIHSPYNKLILQLWKLKLELRVKLNLLRYRIIILATITCHCLWAHFSCTNIANSATHQHAQLCSSYLSLIPSARTERDDSLPFPGA